MNESNIFRKACFEPIPDLILVQWDVIIMPLGKISPQKEIVMNGLSPYLLYIKLQYIKICGSKKLKSFSFGQKTTNHNGNQVIQMLIMIVYERITICEYTFLSNSNSNRIVDKIWRFKWSSWICFVIEFVDTIEAYYSFQI